MTRHTLLAVCLTGLVPLLVAGDVERKETWEPYAFKGTETFRYEITQGEGDTRVTGSYEIALTRSKDKYKVSLKGELGDNAGSFATTTSKPEDLPALVLAQAFMNPWVAPLAVTVFTPAVVSYATIGTTGQSSWDVGSKWSRSEDGETITIEVPETCSYGGRSGKLVRMSKDGEVGYEGCIDTGVALPLYAFMKDDKGSYTATLKSYSE